MPQQIPLDGTGCVIDQKRVYRFALLGFSAFRFYLKSEKSRKMLPLKTEPPEPSLASRRGARAKASSGAEKWGFQVLTGCF